MCVLIELGSSILDRLFVWGGWPTGNLLRDLFDLASETSLPHGFATTQLLMISLTLWLIYTVARKKEQQAARWLVPAIFFSWMTFVHGVHLLSRLGRAANQYWGSQIEVSESPSWLVALMLSDSVPQALLLVLVVPLGMLTMAILWRTLRGSNERILLGLTVTLFVGSVLAELSAQTRTHLAISNLLEMMGGTILWFLLLKHAAGLSREYRVTIDDKPPAAGLSTPIDSSAAAIFHLRRTPTIRRVVVACLLTALVLVLLDYRVTLLGFDSPTVIRRMFDIGREDSLPNWFSALQTLLSALTLWMVFLVVRARDGSRWVRGGWLIVALFFTYMAIDDGSRFHENMGAVLEDLARRFEGGNDWGLRRFPSYAWHLFLFPLFGVAGLFSAIFLIRQVNRARTRMIVLLAFGLFGLAIGLDFVEGLDWKHPWSSYAGLVNSSEVEVLSRRLFDRSAHYTVHHFSKSLEELLEMLAGTLLWSVFLTQLFQVGADLRIRIRVMPGTLTRSDT
jgi:hypothetical protein